MAVARDDYAVRVHAHAAARSREERLSVSLSRWRLATFLPGLGLLIWASGGAGLPAYSAAAILLLVFGALVVWHARVEERSARCEALRVVNQRAIARIDRDWDALPAADPPHGISLEGHPYAQDLDLFGRASLFQWLGRAATPNGATTLARWLLSAADPSEIVQRQDAIGELGGRTEWRERSPHTERKPRVTAGFAWRGFSPGVSDQSGQSHTWQERRLVVRSLAFAASQEQSLRQRVARAVTELNALDERKQGKPRLPDHSSGIPSRRGDPCQTSC